MHLQLTFFFLSFAGLRFGATLDQADSPNSEKSSLWNVWAEFVSTDDQSTPTKHYGMAIVGDLVGWK